ncbi:MAG: bacterial transcriptional activator domain-containing protein [Clostridium sp.]|nr:bacterial transcriptional activator domain-containing protein [Clostridium sp.]MBO6150458.1 bacterial transcriptional activator domain-containing protein [Clostridium sp.]
MTGTERKPTELYVQTLGGFHVFMDGEELDFGNNPTANAVKLIAIVFLNAKTGISRKQLVTDVFGTKLLSDRNNSFNNLLYQARHLLMNAGITGNRLIENHRGQVKLEDGIHVTMDRDEFLHYMALARKASDDEEKHRLMQEGFKLCRGEFLPEFMMENWVLRENVELKRYFDSCVRFLGDYEKKHGNYDAMYEIYRTCVSIYHDSSWHGAMIEALALRGDCEEAYREYENAVHYYADTLEIPVPENLLDIYEELAARCRWESEEARNRQNSLVRQDSERRQLLYEGKAGAMFCAAASFADVYEALCRNMESRSNPVHLMLCRMTEHETAAQGDHILLVERSEALKRALREVLPQEFVYTRYNITDYLVILIGTDRAGCMQYFRRVFRRYRELAGTDADLLCRLLGRPELSEMQELNS